MSNRKRRTLSLSSLSLRI